MCGKDRFVDSVYDSAEGSPPRVRERLVTASRQSRARRITPACAGKTLLGSFFMCTIRDHPRVCGKDLVQRGKLSEHVGSPPRVRERLYLETETLYTSRITPACAGKTFSGNLEDESDRDHPRVCGKDPFVTHVKGFTAGSPPRVRERLGDNITTEPHRGITPACAGKTAKTDYPVVPVQDHPRVCGKDM